MEQNQRRAKAKTIRRNSVRLSEIRVRARFNVDNDVTIFLGDCMTLLKKIPNKSVQLVVTSPPYNIGKAYEPKTTIEEYLLFHARVVRECVRVLKPGGSLCWQVGNHINGHQQIQPLDILMHPIFAKFEPTDALRLRNRIVWHFEHGLHAKRRFSGRYETILWYTKGDEYVFDLDSVRAPQKYPGKRHYKGPKYGEYSGNPLGKNPGDVWIFPNVKSNHVEKTSHPCQFPLELPSRLIKALTKAGDLVLDPFLGSGSTAAAAVLLGRKVAGAEIDHEYVKIARGRVLRAAQGSLPVRVGSVYEPPANTALTKTPPGFRAFYGDGPTKLPRVARPRERGL